MSLFKNFKKNESLKKPGDGLTTPPNEKEQTKSLSRSSSLIGSVQKNKMFQESKKQMTEFEKQTKFSKETLEKLASIFYTAYPDGYMTKTEFIRENQLQKGGSDELWNSIYQLLDTNGDGHIDLQEFLLANSISATGTLETKVAWMFTLFDEDKSGTIEEIEVKKFINLLLKTNTNYKQGDGNQFIERIYSILDESKSGNVTVEDFIRTAKTNAQLADLINSYTKLIVYDVDFEQKKSKNLETKEFEEQVAGHSGGKKSIIKKENKIWKPLQQTEFEFYEDLKNHPEQEKLKTLKKILVPYHGRTFVDYTDREDIGEVLHYIILDDLTYGMKKPCVIDLKMGTREYSDDDSAKKKVQKMVLSSVTASNVLGFRICGMKVWREREQQFGVQSKKKALLLSTQMIEESLITFIDNGKELKYKIYEEVVDQLKELLYWFENINDLFCYYASSILIIYDGEEKDPKPIVKMIDFAHTQAIKKKKGTKERDESYITGLKTLVEKLKLISEKKISYKKGGKGVLQLSESESISKNIQSQLSTIESILEKAKEKKEEKTMERLKKEIEIKQDLIDDLSLELKFFKDKDIDITKELQSMQNYIRKEEELEKGILARDILIQSLRNEIKYFRKLMIDFTTKKHNDPIDELDKILGDFDEMNQEKKNELFNKNNQEEEEEEEELIEEIKEEKKDYEKILFEKEIMIEGLMKYTQNLEKEMKLYKENHIKNVRLGTILNIKSDMEKMKQDFQKSLEFKDREIEQLKEQLQKKK